MNNFRDFDEEEASTSLANIELGEDELDLIDQVRGVMDSLDEMPSEVKLFFDPRYDSLLSEVPSGMVKRVWALTTIRDIKNDPDCDGVAVALINFYKIMRSYNRKAAREFMEMISIQSNDDEEQIDDTNGQ